MGFWLGVTVGIAFNIIASGLSRIKMKKIYKIIIWIVVYISMIALIFIITEVVPMLIERIEGLNIV